MKTKSRNIIISFLLTLAMLLGVFAMTPLTTFAIDRTAMPAETIYVGGVALNAGQYVKNGETTATTGEPAEDADGYAYYKADGTLLLASYSYEGNGYEYDSGMYAVIYSSGALSVELRGENVLKQTAEGKRGIFAVGNLEIDGVGSLSVSADWSIYSNGIITFKETLGKVDLTVTGTGRAIVSLYDSGSATDHDESIFVKGGDISATTYYGLDDLVITGGALTISSSYYALNMHPVINYDGEYTAVVSYNEDGSDSAAYDPAKLITEIPNNYFRITPAPKTAIDSVSVSGIDLPEFGEAFNAEVDLDALTYGGEYKVADHWLEKYTGDEWVEYTGSDDLIEYGVRYRYVLSLMPNGGYSFSSEITDGGVKINDKAATVYKITEYPFYNAVEIACEFSYEATFITSISVSGADLPEVGETKDVMEFTPDSLTYGGEYKMVGRGFQKYTGTEWVDVSDTESLEYGVKYRVNLVLAPNEGYAFADTITSDDVTFNGEAGIFETLISGVGYASILYEFSYEAPATDYGIKIADKDGSGATVGVLITEENCTDVLDDGTVSYDPTTNTLTLNGYKYEGEGAEDDDIGYYGLMADLPADGLTIVLVGENSIKISGSNSAGMVFFGNSDLTIKGDGSLTINTVMQGIVMAENSGAIKINGGNIDIATTAVAVSTKDFVMTGGNLKLTTNMFGFATLSADGAFCINGGSVEISTAYAGYAFIYADAERETYNPIKPDLSGYVGTYKMTAGINVDGSDATDFNEGYLSSYKYVKIEPTHVHDHGTAWESDANEHWNECACGDKANKAAHSGGTATCQAKAKCEVCNAEYGELAPHNYNITNGYKGADGHANTCSCGAHDTPVAHTPDRTEATETDPIKCTVCGYIIEPVKGHVHAPKSEWKSDEDNHWHECTGCEGQQLEKAAHTDNDTNGACDVCGYTMPVSHTHDYGTTWKTDENNHWKECECGEKSENAAHIDGNGDNKCDTCDYAMPAHDPDDDGGLGTGAIVGIVIGSVAVAGVGGFALFWFVIKKKSFADLIAVFKKK